MELTYRYGVFRAFVTNLMADRIGFSDFGCSIFQGQNGWKTERVLGMTSFRRFFHERKNFFKKCSTLRPSPILGLQKLRRHHIGRSWSFRDYRFPMNEVKMERFSLITFARIDVPVRCLHNFCSKFNGGSDRIFIFWICSIFTVKMRGKRNVGLIWL